MTLDPQRRLKPIGWRLRASIVAALLASTIGTGLAAVNELVPGSAWWTVRNAREIVIAGMIAVAALPGVFAATLVGLYVRSEPRRRAQERPVGVPRSITPETGRVARRTAQEAS